jgi:hypothetical protein
MLSDPSDNWRTGAERCSRHQIPDLPTDGAKLDLQVQ